MKASTDAPGFLAILAVFCFQFSVITAQDSTPETNLVSTPPTNLVSNPPTNLGPTPETNLVSNPPTNLGPTPETNLETLKLVQLVIFLYIFVSCLSETSQIFRHGDRVPEYPYPNDPFSDQSVWPEGWAQLTDEGKRQEYQLGQYFRKRYGNYLNATYVANQVYAISSDTDRTIMSALMALAGLYPTNNESNWDNSVNWQPVPLRTIFTEDDNLIRMKRTCPKFDELFHEFITNSEMMSKINADNRELFADLSKNSGVNITTINDIDAFYASMFVEEYKGLDIPEWGKSLKTDEHFQYLYNLSFQAKTYTNDLKRLRTSVLLKYLTGNMNERVRNGSSTTKMFVISGHDITLIDILNTFGVWDLIRPFYSSAFMIELHQEPSDGANGGNFFIELYLRNDTTREPYKLTMPGCEFRCPLGTFLANTKSIIPDDWEAECKLTQPNPPQSDESSSTFTYIIVALGAVAVVVLILGVGCMAIKKKRRAVTPQRNEYHTF